MNCHALAAVADKTCHHEERIMKLHYLLLAALPCLPLSVSAAPSSEESITAPETHNRELNVGDKAPDQYKRDDQAVKDWKAKQPVALANGRFGAQRRAGLAHRGLAGSSAAPDEEDAGAGSAAAAAGSAGRCRCAQAVR